MTTPREYEAYIATVLTAEGYQTDLTPPTNDYGVDIIAVRGGERLAVQVKRYGGTARPVNRAMVMELHGAAAFAGCTGSVMATDGRILSDAVEVARALGIRILTSATTDDGPSVEVRTATKPIDSFDEIWERHVMPLAGRELRRSDGSSNTILCVDWAGVERTTSGGNRQRIGIEIFRWSVDRILDTGIVTRAQINEQYVKRASSGIVLILGQVPLFVLLNDPRIHLRLRDSGTAR